MAPGTGFITGIWCKGVFHVRISVKYDGHTRQNRLARNLNNLKLYSLHGFI